MDAPKRIGLVYNGLGGWRLWDVNEPGMGGVDRPHAEYLLAAEHDRLMAEKTVEIERLRAALRPFARIVDKSSCKVTLVWEDYDYRSTYTEVLKPGNFEEARAALGGDNG